jgi:ceramide glucosyltransferase
MTWISNLLILLLAVAVAGGLAYYLIAIYSVTRFSYRGASGSPKPNNLPPMSLLKPLCGTEPGLETNLESFFLQDYPDFEILLAVCDPNDPAAEVARRLLTQHPQIPAQLLITGKSAYPNTKVHSLEKMGQVARYEILVITDSDVSVDGNYLSAMAKSFEPPEVGAVTNLYRGRGVREFWSKLEALGMSTEFMAGVIVAERLEGMKFMLGPSMAIRSSCLKGIGGFPVLAEYLADDFVLGERIAAAGHRIVLSSYVVDHHAYSTGFLHSFKHRLRWNRSSRFSRPTGYWGQGFTYGLAWALVLCSAALSFWTALVLLGSLALRLWLAHTLGKGLLKDPFVEANIWLVPVQDLLSFATWIGGFAGREIVWRERRYRLLEGGKFAMIGRS